MTSGTPGGLDLALARDVMRRLIDRFNTMIAARSRRVSATSTTST